MRVLDWDDAKNAGNLRKHKVGFEAAERFDWDRAFITADSREDYGEHREVAIGFICDVLHYLVFTMRGERVRIFSLRKANKLEGQRYVKETHGR